MSRWLRLMPLFLWLFVAPDHSLAQNNEMSFLRYLPENTKVVGVVNVGELFQFEMENQPGIHRASRKWYADVFVPGVKELPKQLGITRVNRVIIGLPVIGDPQGCLVVRGEIDRKVFNKQVVLSPGIRPIHKSKNLTVFEMDAQKFPKSKRPNFGLLGSLEKQFLVRPIKDKLWFAAVDGSTIFMSFRSHKDVLTIAKQQREQKVALNTKMRRLLSTADSSRGGIVLLTLGEESVPGRFQREIMGDIFRQLDHFSIRLENTQDKSTLKIVAHTKNRMFAKAVHQELSNGLKRLQGGMLRQARQGLLAYKLLRTFNPKKANAAWDVLLLVADPLLAFAESMTPELDDKVVQITSEVPRSRFSSLVKALLPPTK
ncbi:MAG: hypothetical protein ACFCD0_01265 [Gemmataceae bacterium]